jgi:hypothetical protein
MSTHQKSGPLQPGYAPLATARALYNPEFRLLRHELCVSQLKIFSRAPLALNAWHQASRV